MSLSAPQDGEARYGVVARVLHWTMAVAIAVQLVVGYAMDRFEVLDWAVDRWLDGEDDRLIVVHAALGVTILVLATVRVTWRRVHGLRHGPRASRRSSAASSRGSRRPCTG